MGATCSVANDSWPFSRFITTSEKPSVHHCSMWAHHHASLGVSSRCTTESTRGTVTRTASHGASPTRAAMDFSGSSGSGTFGALARGYESRFSSADDSIRRSDHLPICFFSPGTLKRSNSSTLPTGCHTSRSTAYCSDSCSLIATPSSGTSSAVAAASSAAAPASSASGAASAPTVAGSAAWPSGFAAAAAAAAAPAASPSAGVGASAPSPCPGPCSSPPPPPSPSPSPSSSSSFSPSAFGGFGSAMSYPSGSTGSASTSGTVSGSSGRSGSDGSCTSRKPQSRTRSGAARETEA
mmetsp:Transcript_7076/g.18148  ORF Transcript_7076/g.18148 Transcript_7076/m.18148 type:complete len:295 (-) Transcript_7076:817-1701(-)